MTAWFAATLAAGGCRAPATVSPTAKPTPPKPALATPSATTPPERAQVALEAESGPGTGKLVLSLAAAQPAPVAAHGSPLSAAETDALLAKLEPLPDLSQQPAPIVRPPTNAPHRSGPVTPIAFVAPTAKQIADTPLGQVAAPAPPLVEPDIQPVGEIREDAEIRIRFDEPMIPVGTVGSAMPTGRAAPATITPAIAGSWRWLDTRVVQFTTTAKRLPMATEFTITVPAGTRAVSGATLAHDVTGKFSTGAPRVVRVIPGGYGTRVRPDSAVVIELDQDVDAKAIAPFLTVFDRASKLKQPPTIAFDASVTIDQARASWAKNPSLKPADIADISPHAIIIAPKTAWPAGASLFVRLEVGAPSREGPLKTMRASGAELAIAPAFALEGLSCNDGSGTPHDRATCPASSYVHVVLANAIDRNTYHSEMIQLAGRRLVDHVPSGNTVPIELGEPIGKSYTIHVARAGITDIYGQPLANPHDLEVTTVKPHYDPWVGARNTGLYILDPRYTAPQWLVDAQAVDGVHIELYRVDPSDYFTFRELEDGKRKTPPGKKVFDKVYPVGARGGIAIRQDLRPALGAAGTGHVLAVASPTVITAKTKDMISHAWIEVTKLGVTARFDGDKVSAWVESIRPDSSFLAPVAGAQAQLLVRGRSDVPPAIAVDAQGAATFQLPEREPPKKKPAAKGVDPDNDPGEWEEPPPEREAILLAKTDRDSVFAAIDTAQKSVRREYARWYVTDDRFTYKPGEPLYIKGWLRWTHDGANPDIAMPAPATKIDYALVDARGNKLAGGTLPVTDQGGFDVSVDIPASANLGAARMTFTTPVPSHPKDYDAYSHRIAIQEFRTPAYAVELDDDVVKSGAAPLYAGEALEMLATAKYYSGGGLAGATIKWDGKLEPARFAPPGWSDFSFDPIRERSGDERYHYYYGWEQRPLRDGGTTAALAGALSAASTSGLSIAIPAVPWNEPATLAVDATVTDLDRQTIRASSRTILVHPSAYYVGIRQVPHSETASGGGDVMAIVTDVDGTPITGVPIDIEIEGVLGSEMWSPKAKVIDTQHCKVASAADPVNCHYQRKDDQTAYKAYARVADKRGRKNGAQYRIPWWSPDRKAEVSITPDKTSYRVGDVAKLAIHSQTVPASAIVSIDRQGVISQRRIELAAETTTLDLPIEPAFVENLFVTVDRLAKRKGVRVPANIRPLPSEDRAYTELKVDLDSVRLAMTTRPLSPIVEPGANASFEVIVKHDGKPVANAEVALLAVDEAVLALSSQKHEDPLPRFYAAVRDGTGLFDTFGLVDDAGEDLELSPGIERWSLDDPNGRGTIGRGSGTGSGYGVGGGRGGMRGTAASTVAAIKSRKDFRATAAWSPRLHTDAQGKATLTVKMPDSLTRFRIVALASATGRWFGKAESTIVTQLPINVRTVAPRFLTQGDAFELPVVVQNLDAKARTIDVAVRAANLASDGVPGQRVTVAPGQRTELRFAMHTVARGPSAIQTIASAAGRFDSSTIEIPVYEPATTESFATYGIVDDKPQFEQLAIPAEIYDEVGGVEAEVSSTQLQTLTDAYWYLYAYPYECAEQRSARMLATTAMYDILDAFHTHGRPSRARLTEQRQQDVAKLVKDQNRDGGWNFYPGMKSDPYITQQVLAAIAGAKDASATAAVTSATAYVERDAMARLVALEKRAKLPVGQRARDAKPAGAHAGLDSEAAADVYDVGVIAAEFATLAAIGGDLRVRAARLHEVATTLDAYPMDARARVLAMLAKQPAYKAIRERLVTDLLAATHETAAGATIAVKAVEAERLLFVSNAKTTALGLDALMREAPDHAVVEKLAHGVLEARKHGRWTTTQENTIVLQTMRRYFDTYEKATPNYVGKLWFGDAAYAEHSFVGRSSERGLISLDWTTLGLGKSHDVALQKTGPGRMYYRLGITYAPKQANPPPLDAGFVVRRSYAAIDHPSDVVKNPDGSWTVKLGARVLVQVEVVNTTRRNVVGVVDPLPAGLEAVNTTLANAERAAGGSTSAGWSHVMMRDNRTEAFAMSLPEGTHQLTYTARATIPGRFVVAPTKAEEMYAPETFGRSSGFVLTVR